MLRANDAPKAGWAAGLPAGEPAKIRWAEYVEEGPSEHGCVCGDYNCNVDSTAGRTSGYDNYADPEYMRMERDRRRFRGAYFRRLRHLAKG